MFTEMDGFTLVMSVAVAAVALLVASLKLGQWNRDRKLTRLMTGA
jgi:hypothetical protein